MLYKGYPIQNFMPFSTFPLSRNFEGNVFEIVADAILRQFLTRTFPIKNVYACCRFAFCTKITIKTSHTLKSFNSNPVETYNVTELKRRKMPK